MASTRVRPFLLPITLPDPASGVRLTQTARGFNQEYEGRKARVTPRKNRHGAGRALKSSRNAKVLEIQAVMQRTGFSCVARIAWRAVRRSLPIHGASCGFIRFARLARDGLKKRGEPGLSPRAWLR